MSIVNPDKIVVEHNTLAEALAAAQLEMDNAAFDKENPHFNSRYATLASIRNTVMPALASHKVALVQTTSVQDGQHLCITKLIGYNEQIESVTPILMGNSKNPAQAYGSALTYARRYGMAAICGIASDDDDDANSAGEKSQNQEGKPANQAPQGQRKNAAPCGIASDDDDANSAGEKSHNQEGKPAKQAHQGQRQNTPPPAGTVIAFKTDANGGPNYDQFKIDFEAELGDCKFDFEVCALRDANRTQILEIKKQSPGIYEAIGKSISAQRAAVANER